MIMGGNSSKIRKRALRDPTFDLKSMLLERHREEQSTYQAKQIESKEPSDGETNKIEQNLVLILALLAEIVCISTHRGMSSERENM